MTQIEIAAALLVSGLVIVAAGCAGGGQEVAPMSTTAASPDQLVVHSGTYFGECFVDCEEEITVSAETTVYELRSRFPDAAHPDVEERQATEPALWEKLTAAVDRGALDSVPERLGEPDAADQGGEWIEVRNGKKSRRIDFELGAEIPALEPLLSELRQIRGELSRTYRARHRPEG